MSDRRPWWGHNAVEEQLALGKGFRQCKDGCGAMIIVVLAPKKPGKSAQSWVPLEQVGEDASNKQRIMEIHHGNCVNTRVEGNRDPEISHRVAKNEYKAELAPAQQKFTLHKLEV